MEKKKRKQKKRANVGAYMGFLICMIIGAICGSMVDKLTPQTAGEVFWGDILFGICAILVSMYALICLQLVVHEAGHLVFGLLTGYRFSSFRVGSFMWVKDGEKVKLKRFSLAGTGGQCLMIPPDMVDGKLPYVLYNLGGSAMNVIVSSVLFVLYFAGNRSSVLSIMFLLAACVGIGIALMNGIPMRMGPVDNDGYNAISLGKNPEALRSFWIQMKVNQHVSMGVRLKDMPDEWFEIPLDEQMNNSMVATIAVLACNRLMDQHHFAEADKMMGHFLDVDSTMIGIHRNLLICDRMYCEMIGQNRRDVLDGFYSKALKKFMKSMKTFPGVIRTEYVYALLANRDEAKASEAMERFEKCAKKYPYPGDIQSERELMQIASKIFGEMEI